MGAQAEAIADDSSIQVRLNLTTFVITLHLTTNDVKWRYAKKLESLMNNPTPPNASSQTGQGRTYGGASLADRQAKRYAQFIDAGHELFGTIGFRQTTVRLLCKQAALTDRYFYESFASIEDLLVAVYQRHIEHIQAQVLHAVMAVGFDQPTEYMIEHGLDAFFATAECPKVARIIWLEVLGVSPRIDQLYTTTVQNFAQMFRQMIMSVSPTLDWPEQDMQILAIGMIGAVSQATMAWLLSDYQASRATMVRSIKPLMMGLVLYAKQQSSMSQR
jgi:AcrR family transcriptional regulator